MAHSIPASCSNCGLIFDPHAIGVGGPGPVIVRNSGVACPTCGHSADLLDGVYSVVGGVLAILDAPDRTRDELDRLTEVLTRARARGWSSTRIERELTNDKTLLGMWQSILDVVSDSRIQGIGMVLALVLAVLPYCAPDASLSPDEIADEVVERLMEEGSDVSARRSRALKVEEPGRNDPCPCKSGKKYKKCCGKLEK